MYMYIAYKKECMCVSEESVHDKEPPQPPVAMQHLTVSPSPLSVYSFLFFVSVHIMQSYIFYVLRIMKCN